MNKRLISTASAFTVAFGAGYITEDLFHARRTIQNVFGGAQNVISKENDRADLTSPCSITNKLATQIQVEVIESNAKSGTYIIQSGWKERFFCGDKVKVINGKYKTELTINKSITFQQATPVKNTTNI